MLETVTSPFLNLWVEHSRSLQLSALEAAMCRRKPSAYLTSDRIFYPAESSEWLLGPTAAALGEAGIFYASDWPHWDNEFPESLEAFRAHPALSQETKAKVLYDNAPALYGLAVHA